MPAIPPPAVASLAGLLVGLWLLTPVALGAAVLAWHLLTRLVRTRRDRHRPERAAARQRTQYGRRLAAEWPLLTPTLRLGYADQVDCQRRRAPPRSPLTERAVTPRWPPCRTASLADYQERHDSPGRRLGLTSPSMCMSSSA